MCEGKLPGERAEGLACLSLVLKNVQYWWEMLLHFSNFCVFPGLWMCVWWDEDSSRWGAGLCGCHPAADVSQGQAGCTGLRTSISLPRVCLTGKHSAQKHWPHQSARERQLLPKIRVLCFCKPLRKQYSYPIRKKHRGPIYPPCHPLPESFMMRSSKYFSSASLQRSQEGCWLQWQSLLSRQGTATIRTSNTFSERPRWEKVDVHPCS